MIRNYFITAIRNLLKQKSYTVINIVGLSTGLAAALFIFLFVLHESSYDKFHQNVDRIYRVCLQGKIGEMDLGKGSYTPVPMAFTLVDEYPEIEKAARFITVGERMVKFENISYIESSFAYTDSTFFDIFSFAFIYGNPKTALTKPKTVVLTQEMSTKYFDGANPVGKTLKINNDTTIYTITGVIENIPENSSIDFDFLGSLPSLSLSKNEYWVSNNLATFIMLRQGSSAKALEAKFPDLVKKYVGPQIEQFLNTTMEDFINSGNEYGYFLQSFKDIHLDNTVKHDLKSSSDKKYLYVFSMIALFILLIASINFMNLATARSANRAKEVGVRKVVGSHRGQLVFQFITESIVLCLISLVVAVILVQVLLPSFNSVTGLQISSEYFTHWYFPVLMITFAVLIGVLSGSYPAFFLSAFSPVKVMKGDLKSGSSNGKLRGVLVVFQFTISVIILIGTFIMYSQINYLINKDLGFDKEQLMVINRTYTLGKKMQTFKNELLKNPDIEKASYSNSYPSRMYSNQGFQMEGESAEQTYLLYTIYTDEDFLETYKLKIEDGRFYEENRASDSTAVLINKKAITKLGINNALERRFIKPEPEGKKSYRSVVGILEDFHFHGLQSEISPTMFLRGTDDDFAFLSLRLNANNLTQTIGMIKDKWRKFSNNQPFEYSFIDETFANLYKEEQRTAKLAGIFSFLAIIIACLGLFGLVSFIAQQRTKEIGIRKTLGASNMQIFRLLSKEIVMLIVIASILGWAISFYLMDNWLANYSYHINQNILIYVLASCGLFVIAMLTVSYQALKVSAANPVDALQYE